LWFSVFSFFERSLRADADADLSCAGRAFSGVNGDWWFMFVHANQQLNKRQEYICCEQGYWA